MKSILGPSIYGRRDPRVRNWKQPVELEDRVFLFLDQYAKNLEFSGVHTPTYHDGVSERVAEMPCCAVFQAGDIVVTLTDRALRQIDGYLAVARPFDPVKRESFDSIKQNLPLIRECLAAAEKTAEPKREEARKVMARKRASLINS